MTTVNLAVVLDIESAITDAIEQVSLTGLGADGTSEYEITNVAIINAEPGFYEVQVTCDRIEGKFVGKDELAEVIAGEIDRLDVTCEVGVKD